MKDNARLCWGWGWGLIGIVLILASILPIYFADTARPMDPAAGSQAVEDGMRRPCAALIAWGMILTAISIFHRESVGWRLGRGLARLAQKDEKGP